MGAALQMEVTPATVIRAVKKMMKEQQLFLNELIAATSPEYLQSIREARGGTIRLEESNPTGKSLD